jgi:Rha family phage regulatory protein
MNELTIIKRGDAAYIDSREVAEAIGKRHKDLLRDIRKYDEIINRFTGRIFTPSDFFVESSYFDPTGRELPCYLITRRGADVIANKLTGEKGVLFTAAYVTKFHEMSEREHQREIDEIKAQAITPQLRVFNNAVRNVLAGLSQTYTAKKEIHNFLHGAYKPFGIVVAPIGDNDNTLTATDIARLLGVYSENGLPHSHAVAKIIENLNIGSEHFEIAPYGLVGISVRYDFFVYCAVRDWIVENNFPRDIPHLDFEYHVYYDFERNAQLSLFDDDDWDDDGWDGDNCRV